MIAHRCTINDTARGATTVTHLRQLPLVEITGRGRWKSRISAPLPFLRFFTIGPNETSSGENCKRKHLARWVSHGVSPGHPAGITKELAYRVPFSRIEADVSIHYSLSDRPIFLLKQIESLSRSDGKRCPETSRRRDRSSESTALMRAPG